MLYNTDPAYPSICAVLIKKYIGNKWADVCFPNPKPPSQRKRNLTKIKKHT